MTTTTDESALLAAIAAHPDEDTPRLMYADWLDENDQPEAPSSSGCRSRWFSLPQKLRGSLSLANAGSVRRHAQEANTQTRLVNATRRGR